MSNSITVPLQIFRDHDKFGFEVEIEIEYTYTHGGSNFYGSDEPAWVEVDFGHNDCINTKRGRVISKRLYDYIVANHVEEIRDFIVETHEAHQ